LRPSPSIRAAGIAGGLSLMAITSASGAAVPAVAQADSAGTATTPTATIARVGVKKRRLNIRTGRRVAVVGHALPGLPGLRAKLQIRHGHRWHTIDRDRTAAGGRYVLRGRVWHAMSAPARVVVRAGSTRLRKRIGRVNAFRVANASWYGPGLYGNRLGCGGTLTASRLGVANKSLPCGARLTLRHGRRTVRVRVIDRGPYVAGREFDLTAATARRLHFSGHGAILTTR
jgi:rare lipoprotein A